MDDRRDHWNAAYRALRPDEVSWYDPDASESIATVTALAGPGDPILDVGGGASDLAGRLVRDGWGPVSVLDVSETALAAARARLGAAATAIDWIAADVTRWTPARTWALWHDRGVFHFLTAPEDRAAYVRALVAAVAPRGHAVISTFAVDGPERCSGLPVVRYAPDVLAATLGALAPGVFSRVSASRHLHRTPGGAGQRFQTSVFRRLA